MKRCLVLFLVFLFSVVSLSGGIEWTAKSSSQGGKKESNFSLVMHMYAQGGNVRQAFEEMKGSENPLMAKGGYWIYRSDENKLYSVNPENKSYMEIPIDSLMKLTGSMGKLVKMKVSNPVVKREGLSPESVMGYPCEHFRLFMDYEMEVKIAFIKSKSLTKQVREIWSSPKINAASEIGAPFKSKDMKTGFEDMDRLVEAEMKAQGEAGFPLKVVTTTTTTDTKGKKSETTVSTMEVTSLSVKKLPETLFEVPAGYTKEEGAQGLFGK